MIGSIYKYGGEVKDHYCNIFGHIMYCNSLCGTAINKSCSLINTERFGGVMEVYAEDIQIRRLYEKITK